MREPQVTLLSSSFPRLVVFASSVYLEALILLRGLVQRRLLQDNWQLRLFATLHISDECY